MSQHFAKKKKKVSPSLEKLFENSVVNFIFLFESN